MDAVDPPSVITAISDPEFEGLVSNTLFSQGWSIVARTLTFAELQQAAAQCNENKTLIIFSTDLPGASEQNLLELNREGTRFFGFADGSGSHRGFTNIFPRPKSPQELLLTVLENIRTNSGRAPLIQSSAKIAANLIAVGGVRHSTGTTTLAINLAQEIALLGSKTLLIDANFLAPAISSYLDLRHLAVDSKVREVSPNFFVTELTQEKLCDFDHFISNAGDSFEKIIIDLGSVNNLANELSDRRWISRVKIWASRHADDFCLVSNSDFLTQKSSENYMENIQKLSLKSKLHLIKLRSNTKQSLSPQPSEKPPHSSGTIWNLSWDQRACQSAISERATLYQVSDRGTLRKEILSIAQALNGGARS